MTICLLVPTLLTLFLSPPLAETQQEQTYTTLVIELVGETDSPVFPLVVSTSAEEAEWYKQRLFRRPSGVLVDTGVLPAATLNGLTQLSLLKHELQRATSTLQVPNTTPTVRLLAGAGHDYVQVMLTADASMKILKGMSGDLAGYPTIRTRIDKILTGLIGLAGSHRSAGAAGRARNSWVQACLCDEPPPVLLWRD